MSNSIQEYIEKYRAEELSFFPIPSRSKQANIEWKCYQERNPTDEEITRWKADGDSNLAIVCGAVSGNLVVIDFDDRERFHQYLDHLTKLDIDLFTYTRIVKTGKGFHVYYRLPATIKSQKFPQIDLKAEGGYVIAPPSIHPTGAVYELLNPDIPIREIASLVDVGIDINQTPDKPADGNNPGWVAELLKGVAEGSRDESAKSLIGYFRNSLPCDVTERIILDWNTRNTPPLPEAILLEKIARFYRQFPPHPPNGSVNNSSSLCISPDDSHLESERNKGVTESVTEPLSERIENWIRESTGWFSYEDIDKEFGIKLEGEKSNRRMIIKRLKVPGTIEAHPKNNKLFRFVNTTIRLIDFKSATTRTPLALKYPFGLEHYYQTYPGNIIVVAGSPDAGKTAFLLNFIRENMFDFSIYYQSSEMGKDELASRLELFEGIGLDEWNFTAEERSSNFADTIRPDCVNIIDYLEFGEGAFYLIAEYLRQIHEKLKGGIAIVALQKNRGAELGRGGNFGLEKPRLYLSMDAGKITIQKAKNWTHPEENPNRLTLNFKIVAGCKFIIEQDWRKEADE